MSAAPTTTPSGLNAIAAAECVAPSVVLSRFVQPSSERTLDPVRRDNSFPENQEPHLARLLVVQGGRAGLDRRRARSRSECGSGGCPT
jgi:hypothetical protein